MRLAQAALVVGLCFLFTGCKTTNGEKTLPLAPIIGLFGMAVDGDDKDDYQRFFKNDDRDDDDDGLTLTFSSDDD